LFRRWSLFRSRPRYAFPPIGLAASRSPFSDQSPLSPVVARAFAEAVLWCSRQLLTATSDDPDYLRARETLKRREFIGVNFDALAPLSHQLRSPVLKPSLEIGEGFDEAAREAAISGVIALRSQHLATEGALDQERILSARTGRILLYQPAENVADGASQAASLGFFDGNDAPPWDTWIHYADGNVACWIPDSLISLAQNGIDANIVQCIQWAGQ
jgi:hypothetical protein